jgi:PAS domain S-box-containing protein
MEDPPLRPARTSSAVDNLKDLAEELHEAKERLRLFVEYAPAAIAMFDTGMRYLAVSNRWISDYGLTDRDILGRSHYDVFPDLPEAWRDVHRRCLAGAIEWNEADPWLRKDGHTEWVRWEVRPWRKADGEVGGLIIFSEVITESRHAEETLRIREERLRLALVASNQGLYDIDLRTGDTFVTAEYASMLGYDPATFRETDADWLELLHPEDRGRVAATYRDYIAGHLPEYRVEYRQRTADGRWKWILSLGKVVERDAEGRALRMLGTHTDVTPLKEAEADRARLASAIEQVAEAVMITDTQGAIQYVNPAFAAITGYSHDEAIGENPRILKSGEQDEPFYRSIWEALMAGSTWSGQMVNRKKDGSRFVDASVISPVRDGSGNIVSFVAVKRDITQDLEDAAEKERLQGQLLQAQKMESVGRLAGGVAHDFNNMLSVIIGRVEMALESGRAVEAIRGDLVEVLKAAERSADLTRQLLAFARKQTVQPRVLNLNDAVANVLQLLRRLIGENIELAFQPGRDLRRVRIDPSQIDQLLANLVVNSRDAIPGAGRIAIATSNVTLDAQDCARLPGAVPGEHVALSVDDNGSGMDERTLAHIFEPFFTTKEEGKGTGLGLATVHGIVNQNKGLIDVRSSPGRGTTFTVYLPVAADSEEVERVGSLAAAPLLGDETVLLVEDEPALLEVGSETLQGLGYRVLAAGTAAEAIRLAAEHQGDIALLLTDVVMPKMNGRELADRLIAARPGLACLFMSGYTADVIAPHGILDEGLNFIQKPFTARRLAEKVHQAIASRRATGG